MAYDSFALNFKKMTSAKLKLNLISILFILISQTIHGQGYKQKQFNKMVSNLLSHTVAEVNAKDISYDSAITYLDARELNEYEISKIKNAQWVGFNDFDLTRVEGLGKNQQIIVYCSVGYRSEKITEKLKADGFSNVTNMVGGLFGWVNYKKPILNNSNKKTRKVHAYDKEWGKWLDESLIEKVYN